MRRLARFLPFLLFGFVLVICYFLLTSFQAPVLTQKLTYQDLDPSHSPGSSLRTVTRTTTAYRKQIKLWEAQTSITFSYNGAQVVVTGACHEVHTYAPGWNAIFTNPASHRNQDGTFQLKDTIQLWYGFFLFSRRYEFSVSETIHEFTLSPDGAVQ